MRAIHLSLKSPFAVLALALFVLTLFLLWPQVFFKDQSPVAYKHFTIQGRRANNLNILNEKACRIAIQYFNTNKESIPNRRFITVIDYTKPSFRKRLYLIDIKSGEVQQYYVAHGKNSGGTYATNFSNEASSLKSCKGFFITGEEYLGKHGTALTLNGIQKGVNNNARERGIVLHGANYVNLKSILMNGGRLGRSWGCPAVSMEEVSQIIRRIKKGSLLYVHADS